MNSQNPATATGPFHESLYASKPARNWLVNNKAGLLTADLYQFRTYETQPILLYITQNLAAILILSNQSSRPLQ